MRCPTYTKKATSMRLLFPTKDLIENTQRHYEIYAKVLKPRIPVAAQSKAWVCGRLLSGFAGSNPSKGTCLLLSVVCCQVEVSATGRSLVQRSPTECACVTECEKVQQLTSAPIMRR